MECGKFIVSGEDKRTLTIIKNVLVSLGHVFIGYLKEPSNLLRSVRNNSPDLIIVEACNNFIELRRVLEIVDEEILAACIVVMDTRNEEIIGFLRNTRVMSYLVKPISGETLPQVTDMTLMNFARVLDYERKVKKLNDSLESRKVVDKAKWILVEKEGFTEEEAYEVIKKRSRDNRIPMKNIAEALILTRG